MKTLIFHDLETTGVSVTKDRIVQIAVVKTDEDLYILDKKSFLINPTIPIPKEASDVHGITDEMVKDKPTFKQYAKNMYNYYNDGSIICGYNSKRFDNQLLAEEFNREGFVFNPKDQIDAYNIFCKNESRNLTAALKFYCNEEMTGAHDALNDVLATIKIFDGQLQRYNLELTEAIDQSKSEKEFLDMDEKIEFKDGQAYYNFGKAKGIKVKDDPGFGLWMLRQEFITSNTKNIIKTILT